MIIDQHSSPSSFHCLKWGVVLLGYLPHMMPSSLPLMLPNPLVGLHIGDYSFWVGMPSTPTNDFESVYLCQCLWLLNYIITIFSNIFHDVHGWITKKTNPYVSLKMDEIVNFQLSAYTIGWRFVWSSICGLETPMEMQNMKILSLSLFDWSQRFTSIIYPLFI